MVRDGALRLFVADPPRDATAVASTPAEETVLANARVSGYAWARTWLPSMVPDDPDVGLRIAPVAHQAAVLGLILIERRKNAAALVRETDETLQELTRELGPAWQNAQLDTALEATLEQLRQHAAELQASRARIVDAGDAQRRRIERDLHRRSDQLTNDQVVYHLLLGCVAVQDTFARPWGCSPTTPTRDTRCTIKHRRTHLTGDPRPRPKYVHTTALPPRSESAIDGLVGRVVADSCYGSLRPDDRATGRSLLRSLARTQANLPILRSRPAKMLSTEPD